MKPRKVKGWAVWDQEFRDRDVVTSAEVRRAELSPAFLATAAMVGFFKKLAPGVYVRANRPVTYERRVRLLVEKYPKAVPCLETALWLRGIGVAEPAVVWAAVPTDSHLPDGSGLKATFVQLAPELVHSGVSLVQVDGRWLPVVGVARAVAECFKFRRRVGLEKAVDALYAGLGRFAFHPDELIEWARKLRVERLVRSHLAVWARREDPRDEEEDDGIEEDQLIQPPDHRDPYPRRRRPGRPPHRRDLLPLVGELAYRNGTLPEEVARRAILPGTKEHKAHWERIREVADRLPPGEAEAALAPRSPPRRRRR